MQVDLGVQKPRMQLGQSLGSHRQRTELLPAPGHGLGSGPHGETLS